MQASQNKERTLQNIKLQKVNINGPHSNQHAADYDMTYDVIKSQQNGKFMKNKKAFSESVNNKAQCNAEYEMLEALFDTENFPTIE